MCPWYFCDGVCFHFIKAKDSFPSRVTFQHFPIGWRRCWICTWWRRRAVLCPHRAGVHICSRNLATMSKFWASDAWRDASSKLSRGQLKCDGTRAETRFRLSAKRTSSFKSAGASVQSTTGSRGVLISGSIAGYTMFQGSVKSTGYPLHSPVSPSLPLPRVTVCHHISTGVYPQILRACVQNSFAQFTWRLGFVHPLLLRVTGISVSGAPSRTMKNKMKWEREKLGWEASVNRGRHRSSTGLCQRSTKDGCCTCEYASRERRKWRFGDTSLSCWC
jgi:hypothetical protein